MSSHPPIQIRYQPRRSWSTFQENYVGAQDQAGQRGWYPQVLAANGPVRAIVRIGPTLYIGGGFSAVDGVPRSNLAAFDIATGQLIQDFSPSTNGAVEAIATDGFHLYVGGNFTQVNGVSRSLLAKLSPAGELDAAFAPAVTGSAVYALHVDGSGGRLFVGGNFSAVDGNSRANLAMFVVATGALSNFVNDTNGPVFCFATTEDSVYVGGAFSTVYSVSRNNIARLNFDGTMNAWNPSANNTVYCLLAADGVVYAGGAFNGSGSIGGAVRDYAAALGPDALATAWDPGPNSLVLALARGDQDQVYLGGEFTQVGGSITRQHLASVDTAAGDPFGNFAPATLGGPVYALHVVDRTVYLGGGFSLFNGGPPSYVAAAPDPFFTDQNTRYVAEWGSDEVFIASGTMALWAFDADYGFDSSGGGNHLISVGSVPYA